MGKGSKNPKKGFNADEGGSTRLNEIFAKFAEPQKPTQIKNDADDDNSYYNATLEKLDPSEQSIATRIFSALKQMTKKHSHTRYKALQDLLTVLSGDNIDGKMYVFSPELLEEINGAFTQTYATAVLFETQTCHRSMWHKCFGYVVRQIRANDRQAVDNLLRAFMPETLPSCFLGCWDPTKEVALSARAVITFVFSVEGREQKNLIPSNSEEIVQVFSSFCEDKKYKNKQIQWLPLFIDSMVKLYKTFFFLNQEDLNKELPQLRNLSAIEEKDRYDRVISGLLYFLGHLFSLGSDGQEIVLANISKILLSLNNQNHKIKINNMLQFLEQKKYRSDIRLAVCHCIKQIVELLCIAGRPGLIENDIVSKFVSLDKNFLLSVIESLEDDACLPKITILIEKLNLTIASWSEFESIYPMESLMSHILKNIEKAIYPLNADTDDQLLFFMSVFHKLLFTVPYGLLYKTNSTRKFLTEALPSSLLRYVSPVKFGEADTGSIPQIQETITCEGKDKIAFTLRHGRLCFLQAATRHQIWFNFFHELFHRLNELNVDNFHAPIEAQELKNELRVWVWAPLYTATLTAHLVDAMEDTAQGQRFIANYFQVFLKGVLNAVKQTLEIHEHSYVEVTAVVKLLWQDSYLGSFKLGVLHVFRFNIELLEILLKSVESTQSHNIKAHAFTWLCLYWDHVLEVAQTVYKQGNEIKFDYASNKEAEKAFRYLEIVAKTGTQHLNIGFKYLSVDTIIKEQTELFKTMFTRISAISYDFIRFCPKYNSCILNNKYISRFLTASLSPFFKISQELIENDLIDVFKNIISIANDFLDINNKWNFTQFLYMDIMNWILINYCIYSKNNEILFSIISSYFLYLWTFPFEIINEQNSAMTMNSFAHYEFIFLQSIEALSSVIEFTNKVENDKEKTLIFFTRLMFFIIWNRAHFNRNTEKPESFRIVLMDLIDLKIIPLCSQTLMNNFKNNNEKIFNENEYLLWIRLLGHLCMTGEVKFFQDEKCEIFSFLFSRISQNSLHSLLCELLNIVYANPLRRFFKTSINSCDEIFYCLKQHRYVENNQIFKKSLQINGNLCLYGLVSIMSVVCRQYEKLANCDLTRCDLNRLIRLKQLLDVKQVSIHCPRYTKQMPSWSSTVIIIMEISGGLQEGQTNQIPYQMSPIDSLNLYLTIMSSNDNNTDSLECLGSTDECCDQCKPIFEILHSFIRNFLCMICRVFDELQLLTLQEKKQISRLYENKLGNLLSNKIIFNEYSLHGDLMTLNERIIPDIVWALNNIRSSPLIEENIRQKNLPIIRLSSLAEWYTVVCLMCFSLQDKKSEYLVNLLVKWIKSIVIYFSTIDEEKDEHQKTRQNNISISQSIACTSVFNIMFDYVEKELNEKNLDLSNMCIDLLKTVSREIMNDESPCFTNEDKIRISGISRILKIIFKTNHEKLTSLKNNDGSIVNMLNYADIFDHLKSLSSWPKGKQTEKKIDIDDLVVKLVNILAEIPLENPCEDIVFWEFLDSICSLLSVILDGIHASATLLCTQQSCEMILEFGLKYIKYVKKYYSLSFSTGFIDLLSSILVHTLEIHWNSSNSLGFIFSQNLIEYILWLDLQIIKLDYISFEKYEENGEKPLNLSFISRPRKKLIQALNNMIIKLSILPVYTLSSENNVECLENYKNWIFTITPLIRCRLSPLQFSIQKCLSIFPWILVNCSTMDNLNYEKLFSLLDDTIHPLLLQKDSISDSDAFRMMSSFNTDDWLSSDDQETMRNEERSPIDSSISASLAGILIMRLITERSIGEIITQTLLNTYCVVALMTTRLASTLSNQTKKKGVCFCCGGSCCENIDVEENTGEDADDALQNEMHRIFMAWSIVLPGFVRFLASKRLPISECHEIFKVIVLSSNNGEKNNVEVGDLQRLGAIHNLLSTSPNVLTGLLKNEFFKNNPILDEFYSSNDENRLKQVFKFDKRITNCFVFQESLQSLINMPLIHVLSELFMAVLLRHWTSSNINEHSNKYIYESSHILLDKTIQKEFYIEPPIDYSEQKKVLDMARNKYKQALSRELDEKKLNEILATSLCSSLSEGDLASSHELNATKNLLLDEIACTASQWKSTNSGFIWLLALHVYKLVLRGFPSVIRDLLLHGNTLSKEDVTELKSLTERFVSWILIREDLHKLTTALCGEDEGYRNLSFLYDNRFRRVQCMYEDKIKEIRALCTLTFPASHPLEFCSVRMDPMGGVPKKKQVVWTLSCTKAIRQGSSLSTAFEMWARNISLFFEGFEDCPICYSVLHATFRSLPKKSCKTCNIRFHSECLGRWFRRSQKSVCPHCQSPFTL